MQYGIVARFEPWFLSDQLVEFRTNPWNSKLYRAILGLVRSLIRLDEKTTDPLSMQENRSMGPDLILSLFQEDEKLAIGDRVIAHWVHDGLPCQTRARVVALQPQRVRVALLESTRTAPAFKPGNTLDLPRISDSARWSSSCCVRRDR
jgi:hypothetical protein